MVADRPADPGTSGHGPVADRGLQAERTRLAWSRTALTLAANGALILHAGAASGHGFAGWIPGLLALLCAAAFQVCGLRRYSAVYRALRTGRSVTGPRTVCTAALLAVTVGVLALAGSALGGWVSG